MNRLLNPNGGFPLTLDDFNFVQDAYTKAFEGVWHEFAKAKNGNIVLSGCEVSSSNMTEGYVMIDYEVLYVPAQTFSGSAPVLKLGVGFDPNGAVPFFDGVVRDTYQVRTGVVQSSWPLPPPYLVVVDDNRLTKIIPEVLKDTLTLPDSVGVRYDFVAADFQNGATPHSVYPPYAIKKNGRVQLYGQVENVTSIGSPFLNLPTGFRKPGANGFADVYIAFYDYTTAFVALNSSSLKYFGAGRPLGTAAGAGVGLSLNNICFDV